MSSVPYAYRELVRLEHPYSKLVREAMVAAFNRVIDHARKMLIQSTFSPIPMDTGFLRSKTQINLALTSTGATLTLSWPGVPYAEYLLEKAGQVQVRHAKDPLAENPWMQPSMEMVWSLFYVAVLNELAARGVEAAPVTGGIAALATT